MCGGLVQGKTRERANALVDTPIWAFHGENDSILPVQMSDDAIAAVKRSSRTAFAGDPKYSRIPEARGEDYSWAAAGVPNMEGHASWVHAYYPPGVERMRVACTLPLQLHAHCLSSCMQTAL